ncbi:hypothetical protein GCM10011316_00510 [Roseibium aquae]|uniref:Uncharacterized protein n=1 Tax=Roseibium aquae TaxID=1323746 RepID=A0A916WV12_9HYPH|nr:hypothetical protein GCM10011316_00510 [Roseibium aquae]
MSPAAQRVMESEWWLTLEPDRKALFIPGSGGRFFTKAFRTGTLETSRSSPQILDADAEDWVRV